MAVHTRHPSGPAPRPPLRASTGHILLRGYAVFLLFLALVPPLWAELVGGPGLLVLFVGTAVVSLALWVVLRPPFDTRRLPWVAVALTLWVVCSVLWSHDAPSSLPSVLALLCLSVHGLFLAAALTWHELVVALAGALAWILGLSLAVEIWAAVFAARPADADPTAFWPQGGLLDLGDGRVQGVVGAPEQLAVTALLALVVFGLLLAERPSRPLWPLVGSVLALLLMWRTGSETTWLALVAVVVVLTTALLMRTTRRPGERTKYYIGYALVGLLLAVSAWLARGPLRELLARTEGRGAPAVADGLALVAPPSGNPFLGTGLRTPWVFSGAPSTDAHGVWPTVLNQLGVVGVVLLAGVLLALVWRAWFFAVDRPRWDLVADRPYQAITLLPTLAMTVLLVHGLAAPVPLSGWGWVLVLTLGAKISQSPLVGQGPAEQRLAMERGELPQRALR